VDWLEHEGWTFDVLTDEDLHHEGAGLLEPYRVVISGSHHEYWTAAMQSALDGYLGAGGRFMYLSGNGLYWVTGIDAEAPHTIEIRRCGASSRTWEAAPGEWHLSTTGELGGLWRFRGRAPQVVTGVGMTAEGLGPGRPYRRTAGSRDPRAAFIFDGVGDDEPIGDFPNLVIGHGAAGWEIDRHDVALGSPPHALVVATADGFADDYQHVVDEVMHADSPQSASVNPHVRADLVFFEGPAGGAVFSTGSIAWCGSLSYAGYANPVARVTGNVLTRFAADEPFELPAP
jgi:N,N-dimethylformamidase